MLGLVGLVWKSYRADALLTKRGSNKRLTFNWGRGEVGELVNGENWRRPWTGVLKVEGVPEEPVRWAGETPITGKDVSRRIRGTSRFIHRLWECASCSMTGE